MKFRSYWILIILIVICSLFTYAFEAEAKRSLKFGHNAKQDQPTGKAALMFSKLVAEKTGGELEIQVYPANQLGNNRQMTESLKMGSQDLMAIDLNDIGYINSKYMMMQVPYVFRSREHLHRVLAGDIGQELKAEIAKQTGIYMFAQNWDLMVRHIGGIKPIIGLNDLQGYKIRAGTPPSTDGFKALGANPVKIPLNEIYAALEKGDADGAELPIDYLYNYSIYEVAKFLNLTSHTFGTQFLAINLKLWKSLTPEEQKALQQAANEAGTYNNKLAAELKDDYLRKIQTSGMEFVQTDTKAFQKALFNKISEIAGNWPGSEELFYQIQKVK